MNVVAEVKRRWGVPVRVVSSPKHNAHDSRSEEKLAVLEERVGLATCEEIEQTRTAVAKLHADIVNVRKDLGHIKWMLILAAASTLIILGAL